MPQSVSYKNGTATHRFSVWLVAVAAEREPSLTDPVASLCDSSMEERLLTCGSRAVRWGRSSSYYRCSGYITGDLM